MQFHSIAIALDLGNTVTAVACPWSGPVRHFMELVVSGLSRNPDYTAQEKREYVEWYRKYFSQFTPEELQSITVVKKLPTSE